MTHQSASSKMGSPNFNRPRTAGSCHEPGSTSLPPMLAIPDAGLSSALMHQATSPTSPLEENPLLSAKRRTQNREAQRRFRKRREEQEKLLHERIASLEARCTVLNETFGQKSEEVESLLREKGALEAEVNVLRKQEQILVRLLQYSNGVLLKSFVPTAAGVSNPPLSPTSGVALGETPTVDACSRCLSGSVETETNVNTILP
ncbi:hypothetical protein BJX68DRAFT_240087 [Aspergillus pseudodeflectus]|uniref:BZIP domain-containing protein n=1 Tax=Aspergillus pseudodeflectus TaxID=176178 RepID=A0ABR4K5A4_9EURO